jgi:hypothetical protein
MSLTAEAFFRLNHGIVLAQHCLGTKKRGFVGIGTKKWTF